MTFTLPGVDGEDLARLVPQRPIYVTYRGSHAHGMYVPPSSPTGIDDIDILGVYIPYLTDYFGHRDKPPRGRDVKIREWDSAAYEVRHFVGLLCNGNPNVMATMWVKPESIIYSSKEGDMLRERRHLFMTKRAYHSFAGYAHSQLTRMESFKDTALEATCGCTGKYHGDDCTMKGELGRGSTKRFATGFMGEKRKLLVEKYGYDCKNAAHLIRLLRMGCEFLRTGELEVDRRDVGDAEELLAIKRGEWPLDAVKTHATGLFGAMEQEYHASTLPEAPEQHKVDALLMDILCYAMSTEVVLRAHRVKLRAYGPEPMDSPDLIKHSPPDTPEVM